MHELKEKRSAKSGNKTHAKILSGGAVSTIGLYYAWRQYNQTTYLGPVPYSKTDSHFLLYSVALAGM